MPMNPSIALYELRTNPKKFLKLYPVRIFGDINASGIKRYALENRGESKRPGSILRTKRLHTTEAFNVRAAAANMHSDDAHTFSAHSVHMDVGINQMTTYTLDNTGPNIMVTGQLSGCAFVIQPNGNSLDVSHVKPLAGNTGAALVITLKQNHPNAFVYGATAGNGFYDSLDRVVSIIGMRSSAGAWSIYAQKHDKLTEDYRICSLYRLYPEHVKV